MPELWGTRRVWVWSPVTQRWHQLSFRRGGPVHGRFPDLRPFIPPALLHGSVLAADEDLRSKSATGAGHSCSAQGRSCSGRGGLDLDAAGTASAPAQRPATERGHGAATAAATAPPSALAASQGQWP